LNRNVRRLPNVLLALKAFLALKASVSYTDRAIHGTTLAFTASVGWLPLTVDRA